MKTVPTNDKVMNGREQAIIEKQMIISERNKFLHDHPECLPYIDLVFFSVHDDYVTVDYRELPEDVIASIRAARRREVY